MVHFSEISQAPPLYSMLQHIGRVSTPKVASGKCLRYLQTTLTMGKRGIGIRIYVEYCNVWGKVSYNLPGMSHIYLKVPIEKN